MRTFVRTAPFAAATCLLLLSACAQDVASAGETSSTTSEAVTSDGATPGAVFTMSNAAGPNEVLMFARAADGTLTAAGSFATGGTGTGSGLGSQGALAREGDWLFVVNAGSSDVSVFSLATGSPVLASRTPSGGTGPISLTAHDGLVYVLNATAPASVTGFWVDGQGKLHPVAGSTQPLSAADVGPAQVTFAPDGEALVVTEKATSSIDTFGVDWRGRAQPAVVTASSGTTPFGFAFTPYGRLVVSEASGGAPGGAAVSSYDVGVARGARTVSASVPDGQTAACWLALGPGGQYAFTTNAGSGNISAYRVGLSGALTLEGVAASTGATSHPIDMAVAARAGFLYVLESGTGALAGYGVRGGTLTAAGSPLSVPTSASGLVAR